MSEKIRILIVDDIYETRESVRKLLQFESDLEVIGHAGSGGEAIIMAEAEKPDVVLMDINMPDSDGIATSKVITTTLPETQVIIMSVQSEADYLRRAMHAGARDFLMKPFSGDELVTAVRRVHQSRPAPVKRVVSSSDLIAISAGAHKPTQPGKILTFFSPKGGIGTTTIAVNVAVAMANSGNRTLLIDGSLQFGDVAVMLNLKSTTSIVDLSERVDDMDQDLISSVLLEHESGLRVLLAPPRPEMAEIVRADDIKALLDIMRTLFDYIVIDTSSSLDDVSLVMLDAADRIVLIARQSLTSLKNVSRFFDLSEYLEYEQGKVIMVVNHASKKVSISVKDIEDTLRWPASATIPEDASAYTAADQGRPLVSEYWRRRPIYRALNQLNKQLLSELKRSGESDESESSNGATRLARLFSK
jgi:pilus assembly protein CpaE